MAFQNETTLLARMVQKADAVVRYLRNRRESLNLLMEGKLSAHALSLLATAIAAGVIVLLLFIPPALSQHADGSMEYLRIAKAAGLHIEGNQLLPAAASGGDASLHVLLLRAGILLNRLWFGAGTLHLQSVAFLYMVLFLPSFTLLLKELLRRVIFFSERLAVTFVCLFVLTDSSRIVPFASLSPHPLWYISLIALLAGLLATARGAPWGIPVFAIAGMMLTLSARQAFAIGALTAAFAGAFAIRRSARKRAAAAFAAVCLLGGGFFSVLTLPDHFTHTARLHAMTRGVLLQARDPEQVLSAFGIEPRYAVLTDISTFEAIPAVLGENPMLDEGFLELASPSRIALYYLRHPFAAVSMLDLAVRATMDTSAIYRNAEDIPGAIKLVLLSGYSALKVRALPANLAFACVLFVAAMFSARRNKQQPYTSGPRSAALLLGAVGLLQALHVIVRSGDAELAQRAALTGICVDLLLLIVLSELLHRLNILDAGNVKGDFHGQTA